MLSLLSLFPPVFVSLSVFVLVSGALRGFHHFSSLLSLFSLLSYTVVPFCSVTQMPSACLWILWWCLCSELKHTLRVNWMCSSLPCSLPLSVSLSCSLTEYHRCHVTKLRLPIGYCQFPDPTHSGGVSKPPPVVFSFTPHLSSLNPFSAGEWI